MGLEPDSEGLRGENKGQDTCFMNVDLWRGICPKIDGLSPNSTGWTYTCPQPSAQNYARDKIPNEDSIKLNRSALEALTVKHCHRRLC